MAIKARVATDQAQEEVRQAQEEARQATDAVKTVGDYEQLKMQLRETESRLLDAQREVKEVCGLVKNFEYGLWHTAPLKKYVARYSVLYLAELCDLYRKNHVAYLI